MIMKPFTTDYYKYGDVTKSTNGLFDVSEGVVVNLDVESNINISPITRVAGTLYLKGILQRSLYHGNPTPDNNINAPTLTRPPPPNTILKVLLRSPATTSRATILARDVAVIFPDSSSPDYAMKNNALPAIQR